MARTPQTKADRIKDNEEKIRKFLTKAAGAPPKYPLCSLHRVRAKRICTSRDDPYLTNAGKWGVFCTPCNRFYFSAPAVDIANLLRHNKAFQTMLATRWSLQLATRKIPSLQETVHSLESDQSVNVTGVSAVATSIASSSSHLKTLVVWTVDNELPTLIGIFHPLGEPLRLSNHKVALGEQGIEFNVKLERFDLLAQAWVQVKWDEDIVCADEHRNVLIKFSGLTRLVQFKKYTI